MIKQYTGATIGLSNRPQGLNNGMGRNAVASFFGTGADGDYNSTANNTITTAATADDVVVLNYKSFKLNAGHVFTTSNPTRGLIIYVDGVCEIAGHLHQDAKGSQLSDPPIPILKPLFAKYNELINDDNALKGGKGGVGGAGGKGKGGSGTAGGTVSAVNGRLLAGGFAGGGGGAGASTNTRNPSAGGAIPRTQMLGVSATNGARGTSPSSSTSDRHADVAQFGGGGGGGANASDSVSSTSNGGNGGRGYGAGGGGGSGSAVSSGGSSTDGINGLDGGYAGGFVCIIARSIVIASTGKISADGGAGGKGGNGVYRDFGSSYYAGGGGGGGGGAGGGVVILASYQYSNAGTVQANGGVGGLGGTVTAQSATEGAVAGTAGTNGEIGSVLQLKLGA